MKSIGLWIYTPPKLNIDPWKLAVGRRSFPFGARPIFRGELLVSGRVCAWFVPVVFLTLPLILSIWTNYCPKQTEFYQQSESCHVFCFEVLYRWMTRYPKHRFGRLIENHGPSLENIKFYTCFNFILSSARCYFNLLFQKKCLSMWCFFCNSHGFDTKKLRVGCVSSNCHPLTRRDRDLHAATGIYRNVTLEFLSKARSWLGWDDWMPGWIKNRGMFWAMNKNLGLVLGIILTSEGYKKRDLRNTDSDNFFRDVLGYLRDYI